MGQPISAEEHRRRKAESKSRKKRRRRGEEEQRSKFVMDQRHTVSPVRVDDKRFHHVAQAYQAQGNGDIAYELTRILRPRHRRAVLGARLYKAGHNYSTASSVKEAVHA